MRKSWVVALLVTALSAVVAAVVLVQGQADAAPCTGGAYNHRQSTAGACAWGNVQIWAAGGARIDAVVRDTAADGHCARIEVQEVRALSPDATISTVKACGKGASKPIQRSFGFNGSPPGATAGWRIRVCAETCGSRRFYGSGSALTPDLRP